MQPAPSHQVESLGERYKLSSRFRVKPRPPSIFLHLIDARLLFLAFQKILAMQCRVT